MSVSSWSLPPASPAARSRLSVARPPDKRASTRTPVGNSRPVPSAIQSAIRVTRSSAPEEQGAGATNDTSAPLPCEQHEPGDSSDHGQAAPGGSSCAGVSVWAEANHFPPFLTQVVVSYTTIPWLLPSIVKDCLAP